MVPHLHPSNKDKVVLHCQIRILKNERTEIIMSNLKFVTGKELMEDLKRHENDPTRPRFDEANGVIEFPSSPNCYYFVDLNRCDTHAKIVEWVAHLCDKNWIRKQDLFDFINLACKLNKLNLWSGA